MKWSIKICRIILFSCSTWDAIRTFDFCSMRFNRQAPIGSAAFEAFLWRVFLLEVKNERNVCIMFYWKNAELIRDQCTVILELIIMWMVPMVCWASIALLSSSPIRHVVFCARPLFVHTTYVYVENMKLCQPQYYALSEPVCRCVVIVPSLSFTNATQTKGK